MNTVSTHQIGNKLPDSAQIVFIKVDNSSQIINKLPDNTGFCSLFDDSEVVTIDL